MSNPLPVGMADNYFHICISDEFNNVTGQLINHKRGIIQPSTTEKDFAQLTNLFGSSSYPKYASNLQNIEQIWRLGNMLTED
ncbi:hypothetical protein CEW92_14125 [Bacillaceae bacterium SAS-127]|nr:hypothetical protein CEW92_14125 [Bacillaceae bacterium SAS-127]